MWRHYIEKANIPVVILVLTLVFIVSCLYVFQYRNSNESHISYMSNSEINSSLPHEEPSGTSKIYVDLAGAVKRPGVYELTSDERLIDLLNKAGGIESSASATWVSKNLNMSIKLQDSAKVYIPFSWDLEIGDTHLEISSTECSTVCNATNTDPISEEKDTARSTTVNDSKININISTAPDLEKLSGIGPAYAQKIIQGLPYADIDDFFARSGVPVKTLEKIKDQIVVN